MTPKTNQPERAEQPDPVLSSDVEQLVVLMPRATAGVRSYGIINRTPRDVQVSIDARGWLIIADAPKLPLNKASKRGKVRRS